jgi:SAM-dependent methyltransferase
MFSQSAELYDLIYSNIKDYSREAAQIATLLQTVRPGCRSILDVACGTGEHAHLLATRHRFKVDGLDFDPAFVRIAKAKHSDGQFYEGNMVDFHLGRRFDAVLCLGSSIGYVRVLPDVCRALACFREHLATNGVVIVEPWFTPEVLEDGRTTTRTAETQGLRVVRVSRTELDGRLSRLWFDYEIHGPDGVRHASEVHELGLFTTDEMLRTFDAAGLVAEHDARGLTGRGLFVARAAA